VTNQHNPISREPTKQTTQTEDLPPSYHEAISKPPQLKSDSVTVVILWGNIFSSKTQLALKTNKISSIKRDPKICIIWKQIFSVCWHLKVGHIDLHMGRIDFNLMLRKTFIEWGEKKPLKKHTKNIYRVLPFIDHIKNS
jgi:hypothetical protein